MIKINEIFFSIQGESSLAGTPTVFIRTSGCHLRCHYCDTKYAYHEGKKMSVEAIIREVQKYSTHYVCLTGGEPLLQKESFTLMNQLCDENFFVSLETSGDISCTEVDPRVKKIIDIKTPDSGEADHFHKDNWPIPIGTSNTQSEFKFVICSEKDFQWSEDLCQRFHLFDHNLVLYSPSFGKIDEKWLAQKILFKKSKARLQLQLHKYIWSKDLRGV